MLSLDFQWGRGKAISLLSVNIGILLIYLDAMLQRPVDPCAYYGLFTFVRQIEVTAVKPMDCAQTFTNTRSLMHLILTYDRLDKGEKDGRIDRVELVPRSEQSIRVRVKCDEEVVSCAAYIR